jgi:hypothetical protein
VGGHRRFTRRSLLVASAAVVAGCHGHPRAPTTATADPDAPALIAAAAAEASLVATYDAAIVAATGHRRAHLQVGRAAHAVHLRSLQSLAKRPTTGRPSGAGIPSLLRTSVRHLQEAARRAHGGEAAALLASIAAAHRALADDRPA